MTKYKINGNPATIYADGSIKTTPVCDIKNPKPEKAVLKECLGWLNGLSGCKADRLNNGMMTSPSGGKASYGIKGAGDIIACYWGRHIEIECKKGTGGKLSRAQQRRREQIQDVLGTYLIVHDLVELKMLWDSEVESMFR